MSRRGELRRLIAEQSADAQTDRLPASERDGLRATDLGVDLDRFEAPRARRQWAVYLVGCDPHQWDAAAQPDAVFIRDPGPDGAHAADHLAEHFARRSFPIRCPICLERPLPRGWYCLGCDRAGLDALDADPAHGFSYPGEPAGSRYNWEYLRASGLIATKYRPDPAGRRGGKGA